MKFLFDLFPVILFFGVFKWAEKHIETAHQLVQKTLSWLVSGGAETMSQAPILLATAIAIVATFLQIAYLLIRRQKIEVALWISLVVIVVFGGATIYFNSEEFIKWKPTVLYWLFAVCLIGSQFLFKKNIMRMMMGGKVVLPESVWANLNVSWAAFFALMGVLNLYVAFWGGYTTAAWVNFKLFGGTGLMLVFVVAQSFYLSKHIKEMPESK